MLVFHKINNNIYGKLVYFRGINVGCFFTKRIINLRG